MKRSKISDAVVGDEKHLAAVESTVLSPSCQVLIDFVTAVRYDDGAERVPGEIRIRTKGRSWELQLIDIDGRAHCRFLAPCVDDVLALAVLGLETEELPWQLADWLPVKKKKK